MIDPAWLQVISAIDVMGVIVTCVYATKAWRAAHEARQDRLMIEQIAIRLVPPPVTPPFPLPKVIYRGEEEAAGTMGTASSLPNNGDKGPPTPKDDPGKR